MSKVIYIESNGAEHVVEAEPGRSLMQLAVDNMIPGILGDCGGACSCATCHAYVDPSWLDKVPPKSEDEAFMLEAALDVRDNSRLCCQLKMRPEWDGLVIRLPESQV
jgi:2Fe-2S ferredoxin